MSVQDYARLMNSHIAVLKHNAQLREVLEYYRDECTGHEPSLSVFQLKVDEALDTPQAIEHVEPTSPTADMNIAQRILHVGGRNNEAGYVEFGSIQAVEALVHQVIRDLPQLEAQGEVVAWLYTDAQSGDICADTDPSAYSREVATGYMYKRALVLAPYAAPKLPAPEGYKLVPIIPTEAQWNGLARDMMMWLDMDGRHTAGSLFKHLERCGTEIPQWLRDEPEMKNLDHVPSKGTRVTIIYRAMLAAHAPKEAQ